jgi:hypothetical protein
MSGSHEHQEPQRTLKWKQRKASQLMHCSRKWAISVCSDSPNRQNSAVWDWIMHIRLLRTVPDDWMRFRGGTGGRGDAGNYRKNGRQNESFRHA